MLGVMLYLYILIYSKRDIAVSNFLMHEVHCRRNIVLCDHCKEPVPRSELEEHFEEYHAPVKCDLCTGVFEKDVIQKHKVMYKCCFNKPGKIALFYSLYMYVNIHVLVVSSYFQFSIRREPFAKLQ